MHCPRNMRSKFPGVRLYCRMELVGRRQLDDLLLAYFPSNRYAQLLLISAQSNRQLQVLGCYRNEYRMNSTQILIFIQILQLVLARDLQHRNRFDLNLEPPPMSCAISCTKCTKGFLRISNSVLFWNFRISRSATVPERKRCGSRIPPSAVFVFRAAAVASCLLDALPPVDLLAVWFVRTIVEEVQVETLFINKMTPSPRNCQVEVFSI